MKKMTLAIATALVATIGFSSLAFADSMTFASGPPKKGFSKIFANINTVCGNEVPMKELNTEGALDNTNALASKEATVAIISADVYQSMEKTDDAIGRLRAVMSLNNNLVHIIAKNEPIVTGKVCSGKMIMGKCITGSWQPVMKSIDKAPEDLTGLTGAAVGSAQVFIRRHPAFANKVNVIDAPNDDAAKNMLKSGQVQFIITMAAYPAGPVQSIKPDMGFKLVNWTGPASGVYKLTKKNYKNLGAYGVTMLSVPNVLFSRPVDPSSEVGQQVTKLKACISRNMGNFKDKDGFEASWNDNNGIAPPDDFPAWNGGGGSTSKKKKR